MRDAKPRDNAHGRNPAYNFREARFVAVPHGSVP
jgi:hypothetical protein